jgi:cysteine-rich repeat protein
MQKNERFFWMGCVSVACILFLGTQVFAQRSLLYSFPDVPKESAFGDAVRHYVLLGVIEGYENGLFGPQDFLTRAQAVLLLRRYENRLIAPLREQMQEVRSKLSLGTCGDSLRGTGEECDDGNIIGGDGCSAQCLAEVIPGGCLGGHSFGETYSAPDGCNSCICTREGVACTKMACRSCDPIVCDDGTSYPTCSEEGAPISYLIHPCTAFDSPEPEPGPQPVSSGRPHCGNGICEDKENDLPPDRRFHCPMDCTGKPAVAHCEEKKQEFFDLAKNYKTCQTTDDCRKVEQSCPFLTCGEAVNKSGFPSMVIKANTVIDTCGKEGNISACALCVFSVAVCEEGRCVLKKQ